MRDFVTRLKEEVDQKIRVIETSEGDLLRRSVAASGMYEEIFDRLKKFISAYVNCLIYIFHNRRC